VDNDGVEATVVVKNPCNFPIEFYALDFDEQYLEKGKVRRQAHVHAAQVSQHSSIPRLSPFLGSEEMGRMMRIKGRQEADFSPWFCTAAHHRSVSFSPESMVKATGGPFSQAVLRHLSSEAQSHQGIVVIIHGPPRAGKTEIAAALCQYYGAATVSIDTVVKEAMAND
ncbi:HYDIN protein, partial [Passerina amoena]|nr:HYDIN protein [Passerina amoena]